MLDVSEATIGAILKNQHQVSSTQHPVSSIQ